MKATAALLAFFFSASCALGQSFDTEVRTAVKLYGFSIVGWEFNNEPSNKKSKCDYHLTWRHNIGIKY
jgi:hypothetical protein